MSDARAGARCDREALGSRFDYARGSLLAAHAMVEVRRPYRMAFAALVVAACSVETTHYANPDSLAKKSLRDPDGGYPTPAPDAAVRTCVGGSQSDPGCAVTWSKDIYPSIVVAKCSGEGCHAPGSSAPTVFPGDPAATYAAFVGFVLPADKQKTPPRYYVDPCSRDSAASSMSCNLTSPATCGNGMPLTGPLATTELDKIDAWLRCGAPP